MSTYPPRACGVAAYTHDLAAAVGDREIAAIVDPAPADPEGTPRAKHPKMPQQIEIHHRMRRNDLADQLRVAGELSRCADVVSIQHGPGIWGGEDGRFVLDFVGALAIPSVATLHSVPRTPSDRDQAVIAELVDRTDATIVLSRVAAERLATTYGADPDRIAVIPHGVLDLPLVDPEQMKPTLELDGREVILSFGLLGPGKGYAEMIEALPAVVAAHPTACYVIVGATLADLVEADDETCRASLVARVAALRLTEHVRFVDRFVGRVELSRWLEAADVFVAPYRDPDKDSSGTLAYAMGAGRATVSTHYACAEELLADDRGVVVASESAGDLAAAVDALLRDPDRRAAIGRRAYDHTRSMTWSRIGAEYRSLLGSVASAAAPTHAAPAGGRAPRASRHRSAVAAAEA